MTLTFPGFRTDEHLHVAPGLTFIHAICVCMNLLSLSFCALSVLSDIYQCLNLVKFMTSTNNMGIIFV